MNRYRTIPIALVSLLTAFFCVAQGFAQSTRSAASHKAKPGPNNYGSPLDTIMSTRLWTDVPAAQGFVRDTRPDSRGLDYTPLTGTDPDRPKPRTASEVTALQAELEADGAKNEKKARGLRGPLPAATPQRAKHKTAANR